MSNIAVFNDFYFILSLLIAIFLIVNLNVDSLIFYRYNTVVSGLQAVTIPAGIKTRTHSGLYMAIASTSAGTNGYATVQDFNKTTVITNTVAVTKVTTSLSENYAKVWAVSNTSQQIWFASSGATNLNSVGLYTLGWETIY